MTGTALDAPRDTSTGRAVPVAGMPPGGRTRSGRPALSATIRRPWTTRRDPRSWTVAELLTHPDVSRDLIADPRRRRTLSSVGWELSGRLRPGVEKARVIRAERGRMVGPLYLLGDRKLSGPLIARYKVKVVRVRLHSEAGGTVRGVPA